MSAPIWNFEPLSPNAEEHGISEWDQFDKEELGIDTTLLREATQNSLDAREVSAQTTVRVRIRWFRADELDGPEWLDEVLAPLRPHLDAVGHKLERPKYAALVVEDFGTSGLTGLTNDPNDVGHFRGFFYRHSSSHKSGTKGGRWGLGKLVFARMSAWSCWFGFTSRADGRTLLMGKAAVGPRQVAGERYPAFARWAVVDDDGFERPIEEQGILARFRDCCRLGRGDRETGLSVVVPWPKSEPDIGKLRYSVLNEWAVPILRGRLVFEIQDEVIDAEVASTLLPQIFGERAARFVEAIASDEAPVITFPELRAYPEAVLDEERVDPTDLEMLRARYDEGEIVSVRIPVVLLRKEGEKADSGQVTVYLARTAEAETPQELRLRDDITVPGGIRFTADGVHNALVAEGPTAEFLADAEPPAHDTWTVTTKLKERWRYDRKTLILIRTSPAKLYSLLVAGAERDLPNELLQYFWFEDSEGSGTGRMRAKPKPKRTPDTPTDLPPPRPRQLTIDQEDGGFTVRAGPGLTTDHLPCSIRISMAYDLEDGDPFRSWSPHDFNLGDRDNDIEIERDGASIVELRGNQLLIEARDQDFRVSVHGFDPNRDLEVRVNRLQERAP